MIGEQGSEDYEHQALSNIRRCRHRKYKYFALNFSKYGNASIIILKKALELLDCPTLQRLKLKEMQFEDNIVDELMYFQFNKLKEINLWNSNIGQVGVRKIVKKEWPALNWIGLSGTNIGDEGLNILLTSKIHKQLEHIDISYDKITYNGLRWLLSADLWNLKQLQLDGNKVGRRGIQFLAKTRVPQLKCLSLQNCELNSQNIKHLCKTQWPNFKELRISQNIRVNPECLTYLQGASWELQKILTSFTDSLSIHYLSSTIISSTCSGQLIILIQQEIVEGLQTFMNGANVTLTNCVKHHIDL